ncbi:MAG: curli production assembly/transport component CsgG [Bacteroidetes bacterium]|nr:MAG: curli production assembly/transport component CsgG [Bacteroidota bacterium]
MLFVGMLFPGCGIFFHPPMQSHKARLGEPTQTTVELQSLPAPREPIVVAVYKFRDQTGQYKPSENGASWSTAVTQGATSILIKALEDSGWFVPIERENVGNLLNERKIIRSSRAQYQQQQGNNQNQPLLPPLLYAGVLLEGGVISYDANVITGGAGVRYFGTGASSQYRQDRVTIYLRAVSTSNGKILKTVYTSKTILSQKLDGGIFQFVQFGRLLEAETGFTYNEPAEIAVTEAIEKAVISLVIEGIEDGLWQLEDDADKKEYPIKDYKAEKALTAKSDIFGRELDNRRKLLGLNLATTSLLYKGDFPNPALKTGIETGLTFSPAPPVGIRFNMGFSQLGTKNFYQSNVSYFEIGGEYRVFPFDNFTPFLQAGYGYLTENVAHRFDYSSTFYNKVNFGGGFEYMLNSQVGIKVAVDYNYLFTDNFDLIEQGKYNDFYWRGNVGVSYYFGKKVESTQRKFEKPEPDSGGVNDF